MHPGGKLHIISRDADYKAVSRDLYKLHSIVIRSVLLVFNRSWLKFFAFCLFVNAVLALFVFFQVHTAFVSNHTSENNCLMKTIESEITRCTSRVPGKVVEIIEIKLGGVLKEMGLHEAIQPENAESLFVDPSYSFSYERGFLMLNKTYRITYSIEECDIEVHPSCMENQFLLYSLNNFVGYDTAILNTFLELYGKNGYLYSARSDEFFHLEKYDKSSLKSVANLITRRLWILLLTSILYIVTTTFANRTLCESQYQTLQLSIAIRKGFHSVTALSYALVIIRHVFAVFMFVPVLLGMLFLFSKVYADQMLTFMVLASVWLSELVSLVAMRSEVSSKRFPVIFFIFFYSFHIYYLSYPSGFAFLAFAVMAMFLLHSIFSLWVNHEIPALLQGRINEKHILESRIDSQLDVPFPSLSMKFFLKNKGIMKEDESEKVPPISLNTKVCEQNQQKPRKKRQTVRSPSLAPSEVFSFNST